MKSLLVDAIRRANTDDIEHSVSDSGSFDTADAEFGETANDAVLAADESAADELELLASTGVLVVGDEPAGTTAHSVPEYSRFENSDLQQSIAHSERHFSTADERAPALVRYSPLICILLAVVAAGCWFLYQQVESRYFRDAFLSDRHRANVNDNGMAGALANAESNVDRFPFIGVSAADSAAKPSTSSEISGAAGPLP